MITGVMKNPAPVQVSRGPIDDVHDVRAIKPLASRHKQLGHEQLFGSQHSRWNAEDRCWLCVADPGLIDAERGIAHPGDEVYEIIIATYFGKPYGVAYFTMESASLQVFQGGHPVLGGQEQIEIFGGAAYSGMLQQRVSPGNRERNTLLLERHQHLPSQRFLLLGKFRGNRRSYRQTLRSMVGMLRHFEPAFLSSMLSPRSVVGKGQGLSYVV